MRLLILGSDRFDRLPELLTRDPHDTPVTYIPTAADAMDDGDLVERELALLRDMGLPVTTLSLAGTSRNAVAAALATSQLLFVTGGNVFYLLHHANLSGFTELVPPLVDSGSLIYVGISAGAHLATPDLLPSVRETTRSVVPDLVATTAMGLVPFSVVPHYGQEHRADHHRRILASPQTRPLVPITDEQFVVVRGTQWSVVPAVR
jgi:dipeptidase E